MQRSRDCVLFLSSSVFCVGMTPFLTFSLCHFCGHFYAQFCSLPFAIVSAVMSLSHLRPPVFWATSIPFSAVSAASTHNLPRFLSRAHLHYATTTLSEPIRSPITTQKSCERGCHTRGRTLGRPHTCSYTGTCSHQLGSECAKQRTFYHARHNSHAFGLPIKGAALGCKYSTVRLFWSTLDCLERRLTNPALYQTNPVFVKNCDYNNDKEIITVF